MLRSTRPRRRPQPLPCVCRSCVSRRRSAATERRRSLPPACAARTAGAATLPDGKILVVGGVEDSSAASYDTADRKGENPTHTVYDPATE